MGKNIQIAQLSTGLSVAGCSLAGSRLVQSAWSGAQKICGNLWRSVFILLVAGCGGPTIQSLTWNPPPWTAGEVSEYQITDVNGNYAGTARYEMAAGDPQANPSGWTIRRTIDAQGTNEIATVTIDERLRPLTSNLLRTTGQQQEMVNTTYSSGQVDMELTTAQNVTTYQHVNVTSDARDGYVLLPVLRALPLQADYATRLNSFLPIVGRQETYVVAVVEDEQVTVPAGVFASWKVELTSNEFTTTAWFTQAAPFTLVKYVDGRNGGTFELTNFQPGNEK